MREFSAPLWQRLFDGEIEPRFSVGAASPANDEVFPLARPDPRVAGAGTASTPAETGEMAQLEAAESFESLRADVTVALFNELTAAAIARPALGPILMDALDCALEALLLCEHQHQLYAVQEWLTQER